MSTNRKVLVVLDEALIMKAGILTFYAWKLKTVVPVGIWALVWGDSISILIFLLVKLIGRTDPLQSYQKSSC